jgi:hypothetical protein
MTPSEIESRMGALNGALFSDPGNAVQAGEWMQRAAADHGVEPESPDQVLGKLGQDYQKAGLRTPTGLEQITQPFGEAMQQIASVRGQLRPEVAGVQAGPGLFEPGGPVGQAFSGLGAGVNDALASAGLAPTGQEGITQGPSGETPPDYAAAEAAGRQRLAARGIALEPEGLTPTSPDITRLPGILRGPILTTDQELLDQARPDDLDAARQLLRVSGVANPTSAQVAEALRGQRTGQAYAGTHTGAGGGAPDEATRILAGKVPPEVTPPSVTAPAVARMAGTEAQQAALRPEEAGGQHPAREVPRRGAAVPGRGG